VLYQIFNTILKWSLPENLFIY